MDLQAAMHAASKAAAQLDIRIKNTLVKRALKHGMTEAEGADLAAAMKHASKHTKRLPRADLRNRH